VGKLGVMMGCVDRAKDDLIAQHVPVTRDHLLRKVIEFEGALRKSSANVKTLELINALATGEHQTFLNAHY
jgi:hypothetical protein